MKNFFKPARIGFYILMLLTFFVLGLYYAGFVAAGKGQGLAGGAIVLGYGVLFGGVAFVASFFIAHFLEVSKIKIINWVLLALLGATWVYKYYEYKTRDAQQEKRNEPYQDKNTMPTETAEPVSASLVFKRANASHIEEPLAKNNLGLGFFTPNFYEYPTLYFYGNITHGKSVSAHIPQDSLALGRDQFGDFTLIAAPPWLWPEAMNQQFGIFHFKVTAIGQEFITVEGNSKNGKRIILNKQQGQLHYWPDILLLATTLTFVEEKKQLPRSKPLDNAIEVTTPFEYMTAIEITNEWALVSLKDSNHRHVGKGWIRWQKEHQLLINYTLPNIES